MRIRACVLVIMTLLFSSVTWAATASAIGDESIALLLDQLGVRALLEQTPSVLTTASEAEAQFLATQPQPINWRRELEAQLKPQILLQSVTRLLHEHYQAEIFLRAQERLQEPLAKRARYFDLAMTQPGADKNLRDSLAQHRAEQGDSAAAPQPDTRRLALREIDAASAASLLTATLQSAIAARVHQAAVNGVIDTTLLQDEIAERQRYLAPLSVDYLFYDYRYLRDDELHDYRDLLRDSAVQTVLEISRQALLTAIVGELTPPPLKTQPSQPR